ncbi:hypothetical protein LEP1GSC021_0090 [Leptospira noguchii str. 1993005606]|nr:hypothetical protein LEP1GSC021_0090 [Leptospira noguchii str. 1993005606]
MKFSKTASIYNFNTMKTDGEFIFKNSIVYGSADNLKMKSKNQSLEE